MTNVWTAEMLKAFAALHREKPPLPFTEIAKQMSEKFNITLTRNACIGKARRMGLATRNNIPRSNLEKQRIRLVKTHVEAPIPPVMERLPDLRLRTGLTIYQLRDGDCKWPLGPQFARPPFMYCGQPALLGCPYCKAHTARAAGRQAA